MDYEEERPKARKDREAKELKARERERERALAQEKALIGMSDHLTAFFSSDVEERQAEEEEMKRQVEEAASLEDFKKVVIKRTQIEKWFGEPFWEECVPVF